MHILLSLSLILLSLLFLLFQHTQLSFYIHIYANKNQTDGFSVQLNGTERLSNILMSTLKTILNTTPNHRKQTCLFSDRNRLFIL